MKFILQDPDSSDAIYLVEAVLESCQGASRGGAAFAFATAAGAKLLLDDEAFVKFTSANPFDLIVGVSAITTIDALNVIKSAANKSKIKTYVFVDERQELLFHPKFCWFRKSGGGDLIVGSGNLTIGGLRANWEAFSINQLSKTEADGVEKKWTDWIAAHSANLLSIDDPNVQAKAKKNSEWVRLVTAQEVKPLKNTLGGAAAGTAGAHATPPIQDKNDVLIAEIPKSGDRWNQANFDVHTYETFFGAKRGTQRRILLQHIDGNGVLGDVENRPSVAVRSQNYRFELQAASGLSYPAKRPIGIFVRTAMRTFRYRLLMPDDPEYKKARAILDNQWSGPSNQVRRITVTVKDLRKEWPTLALLKP